MRVIVLKKNRPNKRGTPTSGAAATSREPPKKSYAKVRNIQKKKQKIKTKKKNKLKWKFLQFSIWFYTPYSLLLHIVYCFSHNRKLIDNPSAFKQYSHSIQITFAIAIAIPIQILILFM